VSMTVSQRSQGMPICLKVVADSLAKNLSPPGAGRRLVAELHIRAGDNTLVFSRTHHR